MKMILPEKVVKIISQLEKNGYEAYAVGGCVRDTMLERVPEDWDITTSAQPEEIKRLFRRTIDTGIQHGTVTVMMDHEGFEVTTYRIDGEYEDGRHPKNVEFTTNLIMDLERRDFTINAMAYNDTTGLVDKFDGVGDLDRKIIRCVGDAGKRFDEDALRMLRAVRFSGQLGFEIEEKTRQAIVERAQNLQKISAERIRVEMIKLLVSPGAMKMKDAYETGMTRFFLPEFDQMMQCEQKNPHHIYTVGVHSLCGIRMINLFFDRQSGEEMQLLSDYALKKIEKICEKSNPKQRRMLCITMLLHDIAKPYVMHVDEKGIGHFYGHPEKSAQMASKIMKRLTFDNETIDTVTRLIRHHDYRMESTHKAVRKAASKIGRDYMWMEFLVQYADVLSQNLEKAPEKLQKLDVAMQLYEEIEKKGQALTIGDLAVNGKDLIQAGVKPGPAMGKILQSLLNQVLEVPEKNERDILLKEIQKLQKMIE